VGKSTLLNKLLGEKISITSRKPQTTRNQILGILHRPLSQIVFIDTPGVHNAKSLFNKKIVNVALSAIADADAVLLVADVTANPNQEENNLGKTLSRNDDHPVILALNKIDLIEKKKLLPVMDSWSQNFFIDDIFPISAKFGTGLNGLVEKLESLLAFGPPFFPQDALTDLPSRFIVAEIIREKVFRLTGQEIPYSVAVTIETYEESDSMDKIFATIHVERESQKGIIIGNKGQMIKKIGETARKDIERLLEKRIFLKLFVRVQKHWTKDTRALKKLGYE
jgi:GTP-binding protein Era